MKLSGAAVAALRARAQRKLDEGEIPSCQYALALDGEVLVQETLGNAPDSSRYSIGSSNKPVFSSADCVRKDRRGRELTALAVACVTG